MGMNGGGGGMGDRVIDVMEHFSDDNRIMCVEVRSEGRMVS